MGNCVKAMMELIASEVCGASLDPENYHFEEEDLVNLYRLSKQHDLSHLVGDALIRNKLLPDSEIKAKFEKQMMTAVFRYERINYDLNHLKEVLNGEQIPFIPLKGSVIRAYYPEPWMRTSCDIDLLVHETDLDRAAEILTGKSGYRQEMKGPHDIGLFSPGGVHLELHYDLIEDGRVRESAKVLSRVWSDAAQKEGFQYRYEMSDEMFYFYHIAHMAKHFEIGGCGVRPLLDLWVLDNKIPFDVEKRNRLLEEGGLLNFANIARQLAEIWFGNGVHNEITQKMAQFILTGGVYGNTENRVLIQQNRKGGKLRYMLSRIFLPYETLKFLYPVLQKHRWLTPFCEVRRWCKLLFCGGVKRSVRELRTVGRILEQGGDAMDSLLRELEL